MLSCVSISKDNYESLLATTAQALESERYPSRLSEKELNDVFCLQPQIENIVNSVNNLSAPGSKNHPNNFLSGLFSIELSIRNFVSQYLSYSKKIYPSLTTAVIIFPFHYFW